MKLLCILPRDPSKRFSLPVKPHMHLISARSWMHGVDSLHLSVRPFTFVRAHVRVAIDMLVCRAEQCSTRLTHHFWWSGSALPTPLGFRPDASSTNLF